MLSDDGTLLPDAPLARFGSLIREACVMFGRSFADIPWLRDIMIEVGFENVTLTAHKWPSNPWPKDPLHKKIGQWNYYNFADAAEAMALAPLTRAHQWTQEEVLVFCATVRKDVRDISIHAYTPM